MTDDSQYQQVGKSNQIEPIDREILSSFFNDRGYVLDFSTEKFNQFTSQSVGLALCDYYDLSKGKSLEAFTQSGEVAKVVQLYDDLIQYYEAKFFDESQANSKLVQRIVQLKAILDKYRSIEDPMISTPSIASIDYEYIRRKAAQAWDEIQAGDLDSSLTIARTLLEEVFCKVIQDRGGKPGKSGEIRNLYNQVRGLYQMHQNSETNHRINGLLSGLEKILTAIAEMRNISGDAHGSGTRRIKIKPHHARLFVNSALTMAEFILEVSENGKDKI